ncbi:metallophosphoesterase [Jiangella rhizosphaerae]|uniref:Phosphodiesterase n=1 Tax=Jiangella rhizosphaerae TaxID=2293569 RepID=A0A418KN61_9ACTN|nr:metallophosphoesterase [Jiangella rhizosphaerae]RIQ20418.1 phosphodiesterase [Jiangella rhizosphaerae]
MILAHVSDPHVGSDHDAALAAALASLPAALDSVVPRPELLLVTGDLTDHGTADEYRRLSALVAPLGVRCLVVAGNHDDPAVLRDELPRLLGGTPGAGSPAVWTETVDGVTLAGLDSSSGTLGPAQLDWLDEVLAAAAGPVLVALHHPPFPTGLDQLDTEWPLTDAAALRAVVARYPVVAGILCGHDHRHIATLLDGTVPMVTAPALSWRPRLDFRTGEPLTPSAEPPGLLIHVLDELGLRTHHVALDA